MANLQTQDSYIITIFETKFHNDSNKFFEAIKNLFKTQSKLERQEYNLLKAYKDGDLTIGQVAKILDISKSEVLELLEKYDIPFIEANKEYIEQEFNAFNLSV